MTAGSIDHFDWEALLDEITDNNVIPILGQKIYRVNVEPEFKKDLFLYEYLTDTLANKCTWSPPSGTERNFANACSEFLNQNNRNYKRLISFLRKRLEMVGLADSCPLWKIAAIKSFNLFLSTDYNGYLANMLGNIRRTPVEEFWYSIEDKDAGKLSSDLRKRLADSQCSVVYQLFGQLHKWRPAFTEKDFLESLIDLHKDMVGGRQGNKLFDELATKSLLFIGCELDDWLFRFFFHILSEGHRQSPAAIPPGKFVVDNFSGGKKRQKNLYAYLKNCRVNVLDTPDCGIFLDLLFDRIKDELPAHIIQPSEYSNVAFISFRGIDRTVARTLAENLREDGVSVWLDEREFSGGDKVDVEIIKAIAQCPVFIPLISKYSQKVKMGYHFREWDWAYQNSILHVQAPQKTQIIPVIVDQSKITYADFKGLYAYSIPGGDREGQYDDLLGKLKSKMKSGVKS